MTTDSEFCAKRLSKFVGYTIVGVATTPPSNDPFDNFWGLVVRGPRNDEHVLWVQADAEGNGCGWIEPEQHKAPSRAPAPAPRAPSTSKAPEPAQEKAPSCAAPDPKAVKALGSKRFLLIYDYLTRDGGWNTVEAIAKATGRSVNATRRDLDPLVSIRAVVRNGDGRFKVATIAQ